MSTSATLVVEAKAHLLSTLMARGAHDARAPSTLRVAANVVRAALYQSRQRGTSADANPFPSVNGASELAFFLNREIATTTLVAPRSANACVSCGGPTPP